jgi:hypothetical protein
MVAASACSRAAQGHDDVRPKLDGIKPDAAASERVQAGYDAKGRLQKIAYDRNGDGKPDAWGYMDGAHVVRVEVDENGDGTIDRWEFHRPDAGPAGAAAADVDRTLEHIERATKLDGHVSRWEYFTDGVLSRVEEDADGDGKVDKWETYANGALTMMALDTSGRGTPDRRLIYRPDGSLERIEADPTGSGQFHPLAP